MQFRQLHVWLSVSMLLHYWPNWGPVWHVKVGPVESHAYLCHINLFGLIIVTICKIFSFNYVSLVIIILASIVYFLFYKKEKQFWRGVFCSLFDLTNYLSMPWIQSNPIMIAILTCFRLKIFAVRRIPTYNSVSLVINDFHYQFSLFLFINKFGRGLFSLYFIQLIFLLCLAFNCFLFGWY